MSSWQDWGSERRTLNPMASVSLHTLPFQTPGLCSCSPSHQECPLLSPLRAISAPPQLLSGLACAHPDLPSSGPWHLVQALAGVTHAWL